LKSAAAADLDFGSARPGEKQQVLTDPQSTILMQTTIRSPKATRMGAQRRKSFTADGTGSCRRSRSVSFSWNFWLVGARVGGAFSAAYVASKISSVPYPYGTPGYYQAATLAQGSGYNTDPQFNPTPSKDTVEASRLDCRCIRHNNNGN
jgi:hypothetical protein